MGGAVTLRALLALGDEVKGASIWSSSSAPLWQKVTNYADRRAEAAAERQALEDSVRADIAALPFDFDPAEADASAFLAELEVPLSIHHAENDPVTPIAWSRQMHAELLARGKDVSFHAYPASGHLFESDELRTAIDRDLRFFLSLMEPTHAARD